MGDQFQEKQQNLLDTAARIYARKGSLTVRELALAANMNVASINYYFGSKENLVAQVQQHILEQINELCLSAGQEDLPPRQRLLSLMRALVDYFIENPGAIQYFYSIIGNPGTQNYRFLQHIVDPNNAIMNLCCNAIAEGAAVSDPLELYSRYLILLCCLVPPFLYGILDDATIEQLSLQLRPHMLGKGIPQMTDALLDGFLQFAVDAALHQ